jgi:diguanylate cyclase (GGDEF)-like protein
MGGGSQGVLGLIDSGLLQAQQRALPKVATRSRLLSLSTILLVFAIVVTAIAGFAHVSLQQQSLIALREESQEMRAVHRALTQADADVLYFTRGDRARLESYVANIGVLNNRTSNVIARIERLAVGEGAVRGSAVINELKNIWAQAMSLGAAGQQEQARVLLQKSDTGATVAAIGHAVDALIASADRQFPLHESRIALGTLLVLVLQVGGGALAILGLVYAYRSSYAEAAARVKAVASADAAREQVARLFDMADVLQSASDHVDANAVLKATAAELVPSIPGALYVFNNSRDRLVLSSDWGRPPGWTSPETINPNSGWAVKRGRAHTNHPPGKKLCCEHHEGSETVLEIPMIARGEIVGLLQLFAEGADAEARLHAVADLGQALADGMSLALANMALREKLRNQALRDPLTGLYNRRYMEDTLQRFVRLAERENREISLIMIDLDHFKRLNDERGHAFGDQVLRDTAVVLTRSLRETDIVCRYGGEEIVVIMPDCPPERAVDKAEILRLSIAELSNSHGATISASFGVASVPHTSQNLPDVLAAADTALYKAKQNGRNQVVMAPLHAFRLDRRAGTSPQLEEAPRQAAE